MRLAAPVFAGALLALAPPALAQEAPSASARLSQVDQALQAAAERAGASIVRVEVERSQVGPRPLSARERRGMGVMGGYDPRYFSRPEGPCSGVVVGPGLIATSLWNLEGNGEVVVVDAGGQRHAARRVGRDEALRVGLLAVDAKLTPIAVAPSSELVVGRTALLVASTEGGAPLVTRGIVSGLGRLRGDAFTHSARTSFANVGGAIVDLEGRLLGISVRHGARVRQGQSSGVGFGAPADKLLPNLDSLAEGRVIPPRPTAFLGIGPDPRFPGPGVKIARIVADSAAAGVGLQAGDIITVFNSVELLEFGHLVEEIQKLEVGAEIVISVRRGDKQHDFQVKLGERPDDPQ
jgi:S1-C subfamily serine protease